jgi:hypothetical protein
MTGQSWKIIMWQNSSSRFLFSLFNILSDWFFVSGLMRPKTHHGWMRMVWLERPGLG